MPASDPKRSPPATAQLTKNGRKRSGRFLAESTMSGRSFGTSENIYASHLLGAIGWARYPNSLLDPSQGEAR
jgi:hypothetical protein